MNDGGKIGDRVRAVAGFRRGASERQGLRGRIIAQVIGRDGRVKQRVEVENLITQYGDQAYGETFTGAAAAHAAPTGMRLGTGTTAPSKTGAGAAIVTYVTGSAKAYDSTPSTALSGSARRITFVTTWTAGQATSDGIAEVVITNENPLTNVAGVVGNTVSRALLSPVVNKGADDTLVVTYQHDIEGV